MELETDLYLCQLSQLTTKLKLLEFLLKAKIAEKPLSEQKSIYQHNF